MIAEGSADLYPRFYSLAEWDIAAAHAIVKFAGKNVYEFDGKQVEYNTKYLVAPQFITK